VPLIAELRLLILEEIGGCQLIFTNTPGLSVALMTKELDPKKMAANSENDVDM
jgi:hypothetical protein